MTGLIRPGWTGLDGVRAEIQRRGEADSERLRIRLRVDRAASTTTPAPAATFDKASAA